MKRLLWADVAKGACIVLVVLWHATRKDYLQLDWDLPVPVTGVWGTLSESLLPVRMPLFFAISGLFAARLVDRPWRRVLVGRVAPLLYVFVLWTLVQNVALRLVPGFDTAVAHGPLDLLVQLTVTPGNLWYLLALAAYVVVARATRAHPHLALVVALALSTVAAAGLVPTPGNRYGLLTNLVWFLLGVHGHRLNRPVLALAFVPAVVAWQVLDADTWLGVRPLLGFLGIAAGAWVATALAQVAYVGPGLAGVGRRTLPVYVLHLPLVALVHLGSPYLPLSPLLAVVYPVVATALVLAACLALHAGLERFGARWLFGAPWQHPSPERRRSLAPWAS